EVMQPREKLQGVTPVDLGRQERLVRELERKPLVQRRLAREVARLELERLPTGQVCSAAFACSAIAPNAAGSLTARSASTFRSSSMPAFEQPCTNWLYESPFARAAALIRMIHSRRNSRFLFLRSR